ncbi:hypothetical protein [Glutamicibacter sp. PS]|uniref:PH-like domain-containing protein n=1 Tax=Glutamicibacter TaxID=1742989 RepID=UPI00284DE800|nr:hypothetical protein [Glutamicibacter sp. PS]MDR4532747.1 hypothetical protein [Glutamicibacter sp. PS]
MPEGAPTAIGITIAVIVLAFILIALGWRNMKRRQQDVPAPYEPFEDSEQARFTGMYVSTTRREDWLDRVAVHQLGIRSNAELSIGEDGVHLLRPGTTDLHIPYGATLEVQRGAGMAGKFVERDGLVIISWAKDDYEFDTGFRPRYHEQTAEIIQMLQPRMGGTAEQEKH